MIEVFKFYIGLVSDLLSKVWGSFQLTENVNFLQFFLAVLVIIAFIRILKFQVENHGIEVIKNYRRSRKEKGEE